MRKNLENITIKSDFKIEKIEYQDFTAGFPPFMRGIHTCNYFQENTKSQSQKIIFSVENELPFQNENDTINEFVHLFFRGKEYIENQLKKGLKIDDITPQMFFSLNSNENNFHQIAILRASRMVWSKIIHSYKPEKQQSMALNIEFLNADDKHKTSTTIDPWGGSIYLEKLTQEIVTKLWGFLQKKAT